MAGENDESGARWYPRAGRLRVRKPGGGKTMRSASTAWRERIAPDEAAHHQRAASVIAALQKNRSARFGVGRALHRKKLMALAGTLEIPADLPMEARHGVFATPGRHRALVRLSNGAPDVAANRTPDIRGLALKVLDVSGEGALGGTADHQDFLMINHDRLGVSDVREFVDFVEALTRGQLAGIVHLFRAHGLSGGWARLRELFATMSKKFDSFAGERFNTVAAVCVGPYAARVRLKPVGSAAPREARTDLVDDLRQRLAKGPLAWDLELQFFVDEAVTPLEDVSTAWPEGETPVLTVGRLTLTEEAPDLEAMKFDPWGGLAAHRPLGAVMRARKGAYLASQKGRGVA
jgi:hypothetical protein